MERMAGPREKIGGRLQLKINPSRDAHQRTASLDTSHGPGQRCKNYEWPALKIRAPAIPQGTRWKKWQGQAPKTPVTEKPQARAGKTGRGQRWKKFGGGSGDVVCGPRRGRAAGTIDVARARRRERRHVALVLGQRPRMYEKRVNFEIKLITAKGPLNI